MSIQPAGPPPPASPGPPGRELPHQAPAPAPAPAAAAGAEAPPTGTSPGGLLEVDPARAAAMEQRVLVLWAALRELLREWPALLTGLPASLFPLRAQWDPSAAAAPDEAFFTQLSRQVVALLSAAADELAQLIDADGELSRLDRQIQGVLAELERRGRPELPARPAASRVPEPAPLPSGWPADAQERALAERLARMPREALERELEVLQRREVERLAAQPKLAPLREAQQKLTALQDRLETYRALAAGDGPPEAGTSAADLTLRGLPPMGDIQLRIVPGRERPPREGQNPSRRRRSGLVTVGLSLDTGSLGRVEGELLLAGRVLGLNLRLPDQARRDFVAAGFPELERRLAALDFEPVLSAMLQSPPPAVEPASLCVRKGTHPARPDTRLDLRG